MNFKKLTVKEWEEIGKPIKKADKEYKCVIGYWDLYVRLFAADAWAVEHENQLVSFAAVRFNKRPSGAWGRYINSYLVYTIPEFRKRGFAGALHRELEKMSGCDRTKSLIKTYVGFRFHLSLGHTFWGRNVRGEVRCDSPLKIGKQPRGVPPGALDVMDPKDPHPLTQKELSCVLQSALYKQTPTEMRNCFKERKLGYDPKLYLPTNTLC